MKIVYISNSIIPSRTANSIHVMKICQAFADNGHEVVLLAPNRYKEYEEDIDDVYEYYGVRKNFEIRKLPYIYTRILRNFYYAYQTLKEIKIINPDIVYGRDLYGCFLSSYKYPTIFEAHSPMNNSVSKQLLNLMDKNHLYKHTVVISDALKNLILKSQNIKSYKIVVAHDGADKSSNLQKVLKQTTNLKVGYFGHLYKGRGIDIILEVAKNLKDIEFHIVGGNLDDINYWKSQIQSDNIIFHGFVTPKLVPSYRNECDILVAPYQKEVAVSGGKGNTSDFMSPLKIFEYMSSKKAIICSDLPVLREILNEDNSVLVKCDDISDWRKAIEVLQDDSLRLQIANRAYEDFIKKYTWKIRAKNVIK